MRTVAAPNGGWVMRLTGFGVLVLSGITLAAPLSAQTSEPPSLLPPSGGDLSRFLPREAVAEDGRRTMGAFAQNLGRSFVGVFSKDNLAPFLVGASVTGAGSIFDKRIAAHYGTNPGLLAGPGSTAGGPSLMLPLVGGMFLAGRGSHTDTFRAATYDMPQPFLRTPPSTHVLNLPIT